jgi:hypothetical protein
MLDGQTNSSTSLSGTRDRRVLATYLVSAAVLRNLLLSTTMPRFDTHPVVMKHLILWGTGKKAFVAGVADDQGFGWAISKALAEAGAEIILGTWVPVSMAFHGPCTFLCIPFRSVITR